MSVDELLKLRDDIGKVLASRADELRGQLARLSGESLKTPRGASGKHSRYRSGRSRDWLKMKNPNAPAVRREAEEDWG
jgi:hypothetical protein